MHILQIKMLSFISKDINTFSSNVISYRIQTSVPYPTTLVLKWYDEVVENSPQKNECVNILNIWTDSQINTDAVLLLYQ